MKILHNHILIIIFQLVFASSLSGANPEVLSVVPSASSVPKYEMLELTVDLNASYNSPYDFEQINLQATFTSPGGQQYVVDGFYFQDFTMPQPDELIPEGEPGWRIRFSPNQTGNWSYVVKVTDNQGTHTFQSQQFYCTNSTHKGFIKRNGDHLVYNNGDRFLAIGTNLAWSDWSLGFTVYEDWLDDLKSNGANFVKLTFAPWGFGFEWGAASIGNYTNRQNRAWALDWVFEHLMQHRIYAQMHFLIHDELIPGIWSGWDQNPYNSVNGGPCANPQDFLTNSLAKKYYKQKIRYINARWGYSPYVQSWEIMSEADNTPIYSSHYQQNLDWVLEMSQYVKDIDIYDRPVSSGYAWPQNDRNYWENAAVDFTQTHIYDLIPDLEMKIYNYAQWYVDKYEKPTIVGEFALSHSTSAMHTNDPDGITFHNVLWSSVMSGTIGSALSWWWDNYLYPNGLFSYFQPVSTFINQVNIKDTVWEHELPLTTSNTHGTLEVFPDFSSTSQKAPSNTFEVGPSGFISPTVMDLSKHLFGSLYSSQRNPPTFQVNYIKPGKFKVRTGSPVLFSKIRIRLNGITIINTSASSNSTYSIDVPAGTHTISLENSGNGIMRIDKYILENYKPELRTFAMRKNTQVAGWFQNINYNWKQLLENGPPAPVTGGKIHLDNLNPGLYRIRWYNHDSAIDSTQYLFSPDGNLLLDAPPVMWSGAFEAKYHAPFNIDFTATPQSGLAPLTVQFTDQTDFIGGSDYSWLWTFGDGTFSFQQNPVKTYNQPGSYTVKLQVSAGSYMHTLTRNNFVVAEQPLDADFEADPTIVVAGNPVSFTDLSLGNPTSYLWNFGNGTFGFQQNPVKTYYQPGFYSVSLLIQTGTQSSSITKNDFIQVLTPLIANFSADVTTGLPGQTITFSDQSQGDPGSWHWDFGNGTTSLQQNPVVPFDEPGTYSVTLSVTNTYQQNTLTKASYINILEPLTADFEADITTAWTGDTIVFTDLSTGNPDNWLWDFGDGHTSTAQNPQHLFNQEDYYTITLTVSDELQNSTETKTDYIYVREPLVADFTADTAVVLEGQSVQFTDLSTGFPANWYWIFGDGTNSYLQHPAHTYQNSGQYDVTLRLIKGGAIDIITKPDYIMVIPPLDAEFETDKQLAFINEQVQFNDMTTGNPDAWEWDLGNYSTAIVQNPVTSYAEPGEYTIRLDVSNQYLQDSLIKENHITIIEPLVADFTVNPQSIKIGQEVQLIDHSTGNPESWEWWIGDSIVTGQEPIVIFWEEGFVDVTLIVSNQYMADTLTRLDYLYVQPPSLLQIIILEPGWSGISSFIQPLFPAIETVFADLTDNLVFAFNEQGIYSPAMNINTIGIWDTSKGLIINMASQDTLSISGYDTVENFLTFTEGWNMLPMTSQCDHTAQMLHDSMENSSEVVKTIAGLQLSWPTFDINTLDTLKPGKSYFIYMNQDTFFSFPDCGGEY
jgi:PKD repeat protein